MKEFKFSRPFDFLQFHCFLKFANFLRHLDMSLISGLHNICHWKRKRSRALDDYESSLFVSLLIKTLFHKGHDFCVLETMVDMFEKKMSTPYPPAGQFNPGIMSTLLAL